tara:strand:- start:443 stop:919 length:477 start_codon:yes stop_codon:yes gene_type:complete
MKHHLEIALRAYIDQQGISARQLEIDANLPGHSVYGILRQRHPAPETMAKLLAAVGPKHDTELLLAYVRDDVPDEHQHRIHVDSNPQAGSTNATRVAGTAAPAATDLEHCIHVLRQKAAGDSDLRTWFINSIQLLFPDEANRPTRRTGVRYSEPTDPE